MEAKPVTLVTVAGDWKQEWREQWFSDAAKEKAFLGAVAISPLSRIVYLYGAGINYVSRWVRHSRST